MKNTTIVELKGRASGIYEIDPLVCPRCGSEMRLIAFVTERKQGDVLQIISFR